jgi:2-polyprenyl-3-methyl-5-hydroxy-6-metoxy-1,4-benzoquinol methylase
MDLSRRSEMPEMMDDADISVLDYAQALRDLVTVNRITRTHAPVLAWLRRATRDWPEGRAVSVLDVASGQGDLLRAIHSWATRRGLMPVLSGIDLNPRSAIEAVAATPTGTVIAWETGDVFDQAPEPKPDFVVSSQFAHHLTDDQVVAFLLWLERNSRRGWFIADLHRHALP